MSERLAIPDRADEESELSVAHPWWQFSVRFNVAVSQSVPCGYASSDSLATNTRSI